MRSLISIKDIDQSTILKICSRALEIKSKGFAPLLENKIIALLFFEPSTRTKMSFETAVYRLGARVLNFEAENSSLKKGESLEDTVRMASTYADLIVIRHPQEGASALAQRVSTCPIINAGDGKNEHPTQTLLDLVTIMEDRGSLDHLSISLGGDLKHSRTVHSLLYGLKPFNARITLASPALLTLSESFKKEVSSMIIKETTSLAEGLDNDYFYMTRVQRERFPNPEDAHYEKDWILTKTLCEQHCRPHTKILHPLPRVDEIDIDVDNSPYQLYFRQAENGLYTRIALLEYILGVWS